MEKIVLDEAGRSQFQGVEEHVELCDKEGKTFGYFFTKEAYIRLLYELAKTQVTDEELDEARKEYREHGGVTTAELLAHLRSLDEGKQAS